jgi:hypothetical protein
MPIRPYLPRTATAPSHDLYRDQAAAGQAVSEIPAASQTAQTADQKPPKQTTELRVGSAIGLCKLAKAA